MPVISAAQVVVCEDAAFFDDINSLKTSGTAGLKVQYSLFLSRPVVFLFAATKTKEESQNGQHP